MYGNWQDSNPIAPATFSEYISLPFGMIGGFLHNGFSTQYIINIMDMSEIVQSN